MPIYEFYSPKTHTIYTFFARSMAYSGRVPTCPDDPGAPMERIASAFAITSGGQSETTSDNDGDPSLDPRMEQAMAEMEREFSSMDSDNPDPRRMAGMMRKMAALTGQKLPDAFNEMIERMASGEDPEALEAEYGDALDGMDAADGDVDASGSMRALLKKRRSPARDKTLYEITDYLADA
ncbi:MAG: cytochrome C [Chthoniobacterales bacterium]